MTGVIFDIKELAVHDGPGLRMTIFLKGCPLRCIWCHNPEGLEKQPQLLVRQNACRQCGLCRKGCSHPDCQKFGRCLHICPEGALSVSGETITVSTLSQKIKRNAVIFDREGGVTFSGGEPLLQAEFLLAVMDEIAPIPCAIETSGYAPEDTFRRVISRMQKVYMDLKLADDTLHKKFTGVSNVQILRNLELLQKSGVPCVIRTPLIPGITDTEENLTAIKALIGDLSHELLPFNLMAGAKYAMVGKEFPYDSYKQ